MALIATDMGYTYSPGTSFAQQALSDVSFRVAPGELVLIVGSTGSGKSTLLRLLAGLLEPSSGSLAIDDLPLTAATARGAVGLVFQDAESQLFAETVLDDVCFGPHNLGVSGSELQVRAESALSAVGLDPTAYAARSPFGLSGGEARRAAIAGVLAMRPRYLLLDEPTAGLDAAGRSAIREVVRASRRDAGVVVVSHSAEEFLADADSLVVLAGGQVAFSGPAGDAIQDPALFHRAGLQAPDVLAVLQTAREQGFDVARLTLDPVAAARALCDAGVWSR